MGASFTNLQVRARHHAASMREDICRVLSATMGEEGMRALSPGEAPDRTILVGPEGGWISIYDQETEGQQEDELDALAIRLSRALNTVVVTVLVHDSDLLRLGLFEQGALRHRHQAPPGRGRPPKAERALSAEIWKTLLDEKAQLSWARLFQSKRLFAEDTLGQAAQLLGMDSAAVCLGFNYADKSDVRYRVLQFRYLKRPAYESDESGPPRFEAGSHLPKLSGAVGYPLRAGYSVRNQGGLSRGLEVVLWGDALDRGLLRPIQAELVVGPPWQRRGPRPQAPVRESSSKDGKRLWVAGFPDAEIPAGVVGGLESLQGLNPHRMVEAMTRSNVHVNLDTQVLASGEAHFQVGMVPLAAPQSGQFGYSTLLTTHSAARRPRNALPAVSGHALRPLNSRHTLFALASSSLEPWAAAPIAAECVERWGARLHSAGRYGLTVYAAEAGRAPSQGGATANNFFKSARWKKLKSQMAQEALVCAQRWPEELPPEERAEAGSDGFSFGRTILPRPPSSPELRELPTLGLWCSTVGKSEQELAHARELLTTLVDDFMQRASGVQALMGRWGWAPTVLDHSPYEQACGVNGQCTLSLQWLSRFLRGVTDDWIWMGEALCSQLENPAALQAVADTERRGSVLRLRLRHGASLDALEQVLDRLLPTADDWAQHVRRRYA